MARDPLCAVDGFNVHVRVVLARLLGVRMCPDYPHCNHGQNPCQDKFGSSAVPEGGIRCDAVFGGVEVQKSGVLHLHLHAFVQRAHQFKTLQEIAEMIGQDLLSCEELSEYISWINCEEYPDIEKREAEADEIEKQ